MTIFLISDTHFGHDNMYKFVTFDGMRVRPRWECAKDADTYMAEVWNQTVHPEDHVWHLGDVTMARNVAQQDQFVKFMRTLHGHKRLVLGNHDHFPLHVYTAAGFEKIVGSHRHAGLVYSHWPIHPSSLDSPKIICNVHGHIHERPSPPGKYMNVSVEQINYTPIALDEVLVKCNGKT